MNTTPRMPEAMVAAAESQVGVRESGGPNRGPALRKFFESDWYKPNATDDGYAWCASFMCWVVMTAMERVGLRETATFKRPRTPGAWAFEDWCLGVDRTAVLRKPHQGDIKRGDIVIFSFSHIGIAVADAVNGTVQTVEGNTNAQGAREGIGVFRKTRSLSRIRSRIRFMV